MSLKLYCRRIYCSLSPDSAHDCLTSQPERFSALLENPAGDGRQFLVSRAGSHLQISSDDPAQADRLFAQWRKHLQPDPDTDIADGIRCLMYAAYEAGLFIEDLPEPKTPPPGPLLYLFFPEWSCCFIPEKDEIRLFSSNGEAELDTLEAMLDNDCVPQQAPFRFDSGSTHTTGGKAYMRAVERVKEYIGAGDIFQANIARFWRADMAEEDVLPLYARLRRVNPAPFAAFMRIEAGDKPLHILSASPERLFSLSANGSVETRPIAGTRRRGEGEKDQELSEELLLSEKERAEHIMLVDLERNDLGRVCKPGTVEVNERMAIERYATVQHIVSNVRGQLQEGRDVIDVFRAMFPGGTITGCPKVHCMEIIHGLEQQARGPYTGGIGYIGWDGSADMNILIRTFWHYDGTLNWAAGAGIVADSDPESELAETEHKAEGLLRALR